MPSITIGLIGNPNSGKSTLFNALTGAKQIVGNWPGVTVERKSGSFIIEDLTVNIVDLPGTYSLVSMADATAIDEQIACEFILTHQADLMINVIDAANLERNLYLTTQLLAMQVPVIIALNMIDVARQQHIDIDVSLLAERLGCPVVTLSANKNRGIDDLKSNIFQLQRQLTLPQQVIFSKDIEVAIRQLAEQIQQTHTAQNKINSRYLAIALLEEDGFAQRQVAQPTHSFAERLIADITQQQEAPDILIADSRYGFIHVLTQEVVARSTTTIRTLSALLDRIVLNRVLGIPIFLSVMYLMFAFAINIGGAFQDFFDISTDTLFVRGVADILTACNVPAWFTAMVANGIGKGINTTATFIPVIGAMFLFLSFLEHSGYMARAAFVMDRLMRVMGLPGKSFVPLIISFGCNVPAIMATRTLENRRDRILTIIMSPFMSCGARLTIFAVFTAAFFPQGGANIVFALYLIGVLMALLTGLILRKTLLPGNPAAFIMELPTYHLPTLKTIYSQTWSRLKSFIFNAGRVIIPVCFLLGGLNSVTLTGEIITSGSNEYSVLAALGQWITPLFTPMGLTIDNWPATVALLTGTLAKEVVVATLNTLYTQMGHLHVAAQVAQHTLASDLYRALASIPENLKTLSHALGNPILATAKDDTLTTGAFGIMYQHFAGKAGAFAYLLFILLYIPCVSTTAVMARELNKYWALFSIVWSAGLAYGTATVFYQMATFNQHPQLSVIWISSIVIVFSITILAMRAYAQKRFFNTVSVGG